MPPSTAVETTAATNFQTGSKLRRSAHGNKSRRRAGIPARQRDSNSKDGCPIIYFTDDSQWFDSGGQDAHSTESLRTYWDWAEFLPVAKDIRAISGSDHPPQSISRSTDPLNNQGLCLPSAGRVWEPAFDIRKSDTRPFGVEIKIRTAPRFTTETTPYSSHPRWLPPRGINAFRTRIGLDDQPRISPDDSKAGSVGMSHNPDDQELPGSRELS